MKLIALLCLVIGVFCFAAKNALDVRPTAISSKQITLNTLPTEAAADTRVVHNV
ncbi:hypothetical protein [Pontibacter sp. H249]|uniref:hypothetical protein n=1 Tax=Pontibacter sp. H249 TaxID=3133420 RepID=UPI0030C157B2